MLKKEYKISLQYYKKALIISRNQYENEIKKPLIELNKPENDYILNDSYSKIPQDYVKKKFMRIHGSRQFQLASTLLQYLQDGTQLQKTNQELIDSLHKEEQQELINEYHQKQKNQLQQLAVSLKESNYDIKHKKKSFTQRKSQVNFRTNSKQPHYILNQENNANMFGSNNNFGKKLNKLIGSMKIQHSLNSSKQLLFQNQLQNPINNNAYQNDSNSTNIPLYQQSSSFNNLQNISSSKTKESNEYEQKLFEKLQKLQKKNQNMCANNDLSQDNKQLKTVNNINENITEENHDKSFMNISQRHSQTNLFINIQQNQLNNSQRNQGNSNNQINNIQNTSNQLNLSQQIKSYNSNRLASQNSHSNQKISDRCQINTFDAKQNNKNFKDLGMSIAVKEELNEEEDESNIATEFDFIQKYSYENYHYFFEQKFANRYQSLLLMNQEINIKKLDLYFHSIKKFCEQGIQLLHQSFNIFNTLGNYCNHYEKKEAHEYYGFSILAQLKMIEFRVLLDQCSNTIYPLLKSIKKQIYLKIIPIEAVGYHNINSQSYQFQQQQSKNLIQSSFHNSSQVQNLLTLQQPQLTIINSFNPDTQNNNYLSYTEQNEINYFDNNAITNKQSNECHTFGQLPFLEIHQQSSEKQKRLTIQSNNSGGQQSRLARTRQRQTSFGNSIFSQMNNSIQLNKQNQNSYRQQNNIDNQNSSFHLNNKITQQYLDFQNNSFYTTQQQKLNESNFMSFGNINNTFNYDRNKITQKTESIEPFLYQNYYLQSPQNIYSTRLQEAKDNLLNSDILLTKYYILKGTCRKQENKYPQALKSFIKGIKYFLPESSSLKKIQQIMKNALPNNYKVEDSPQVNQNILEETYKSTQKYSYDPNDILICLEQIQSIIIECAIPQTDQQTEALLNDINAFKRKEQSRQSLHFFEVLFKDQLD